MATCSRCYSCEYCGAKGTYESIQAHDKTCEMKEVTCPKDGCREKTQRRYIVHHIASNCEYAVVSCKYTSIGCEKQLKRKDMAAHEQDDTVHLHMALDTVNILQNQCRYEEVIKFKLTNFSAKKEKNEGVQSPAYYTPPNGYHMALQVYANGCGNGEGTHVSVLAFFTKGKYDSQLKWPFVGKITFSLLNQLEDTHHHHKTLELTAKYNAKVGEFPRGCHLISHAALDYDLVNNTQYLKDDTLYLRMSVEPANHKPWLQ